MIKMRSNLVGTKKKSLSRNKEKTESKVKKATI